MGDVNYVVGRGPWLRAIRSYLGLSQQDCADLLQITVRSLQSMESGRSPIPAGVLRDVSRHVNVMEALAGTYSSEGEVRVQGRSGIELRAIGQAVRMNPNLRVNP